MAIYKKLAAGSGPWAQNALYAAGRLQADRGRRAEAARLLEEYIGRYPNGANARDARDLLDKNR
jgi:TolA-binding protein